MKLDYEELLIQFSKEVKIVEMVIGGGYKGLCIKRKNTILIDPNLTKKEKAAILLEEWGHYHTTTKNILDLKDVRNSKEEQRAMDYAIENFITIEDIELAIKSASEEKSNHEIAENLNITTRMLKEAYKYYKRKEII